MIDSGRYHGNGQHTIWRYRIINYLPVSALSKLAVLRLGSLC